MKQTEVKYLKEWCFKEVCVGEGCMKDDDHRTFVRHAYPPWKPLRSW